MLALSAVLAFVVLTASLRVFPIAVAALGGAVLMVALRCLTPGEANSFSTPIGYQTDLMVYGPGGYRFTDSTRLGVPVQLILILLSLVLIPRIWPLIP